MDNEPLFKKIISQEELIFSKESVRQAVHGLYTEVCRIPESGDEIQRVRKLIKKWFPDVIQ